MKSSAWHVDPKTIDRDISDLLIACHTKRMSYHTFGDILFSLFLEQKTDINLVKPTVLGGIVEAISSSPGVRSTEKLLIYCGKHRSFPRYLTLKASLTALSYFLKNSNHIVDNLDISIRTDFIVVFEKLCHRMVGFVRSEALKPQERTQLSILLGHCSNSYAKLFNSNSHFNELKWVLGGDAAVHHSHPNAQPFVGSPQVILGRILASPSHTLAALGAKSFKVDLDRESALSWKLNHIDEIRELTQERSPEKYKISFLAEWFCSGLLERLTERHAADEETLLKKLDYILHTEEDKFQILKGCYSGMQNDLCQIADNLGQMSHQNVTFRRLLRLSQELFYCLLPLQEQELPTLYKQFVCWVEQNFANTPEQLKIFNRQDWLWIQSLCTQRWDENLEKPRNWVLNHIHEYVVFILGSAPGFWLQKYANPILMHLQVKMKEMNLKEETSRQLIEFIGRTLRKKSPWFASRHEPLLSFKAIGCLKPHEKRLLDLQESRKEIQKTYKRHYSKISTMGKVQGSDKIETALNVLISISKEASEDFNKRMAER